MQPISYVRHRFPPEVIRHAIWLYVRFTLSYRDVEELVAERGLDISYETVRRWVLKFGRLYARNLRRSRPRPSTTWHLDEMAVLIPLALASGGQRGRGARHAGATKARHRSRPEAHAQAAEEAGLCSGRARD